MTPARLAKCMVALQWPKLRLARMLGYRSAQTVEQWLNGTCRIPPYVAEWIEIVARVHEENPPPQRREKGSKP